jgi:hypothetical protein
MSKLMWIAGILLVAAGVALGLMVFVSTAQIIGWGIDLQVAVTLLVGGLLALGLGSVISGLEMLRVSPSNAVAPVNSAAPLAPIPEFGRRAVEPVVAGAAATAIEVSEPVKETIEALEDARQKIEQAFEPKPEPAAVDAPTALEPVEEPATPDGPTEDEAPEETPAEGQLYVVEERTIRMRPARILSDGTVEAETEEGWMRFENLEHLDEYLDAMSPSK